MKKIFNAFILILLVFSYSNAQETTREQKIKKIEELSAQIKTLEKNLLAPDQSDYKQVPKGYGIFRLMPREKFARKFTIEGGGSFYSFSALSHDYQKTAQILLERDFLKVGFAGADYGFFYDLDKTPLEQISGEIPVVNILQNYKPPTNEAAIRSEQKQSSNYEIDGFLYRDKIPAVVDHTYILRAINFERADIYVAFNVHRKDTDGSLIIFWKILQNFSVPRMFKDEIRPEKTVIQSDSDAIPDPYAASLVQNALWQKGFVNVMVEATTKMITLRGTIPKGKMAEAVQTAQEAGKKPVKNELTEN